MAGLQALGSRYMLEERISSGGMGTVWRGRDRETGRPVAVKLLHERHAADPTVLVRFVRERTVLTGLRHPNLVPVRDMIMEGDRLALIMDFVPGADLRRYLNARGPFEPALAVTLIAQVCEALAAVHAAGIIHRDLKPGNILLDTSQPVPTARLTDFGIAWAQDALPLATTENVVIGTPAYFAPEVVAGQQIGPAVDVYAAGTTLYEMLTGRPPFAGGPANLVIWRQVDAQPLCPPAMPEALWPVVSACLAKDPAGRPDAATSARLLQDCLPAMRGLPAAHRLPSSVATFTMSGPQASSNEPGARPPSGPVMSPAAGPASAGRRRLAAGLAALAASLMLIAAAAVVAARVLPHGHQPARHEAALGHVATLGHGASPHGAAPHASAPARAPAPRTSPTAQDPVTPRPAAVPPATAAPHVPAPRAVSRVLYSFQDGTPDGWQAGANVGAVSAVTSFADGPGHPHGGHYALDAAPGDGAAIPVPRTMSVTPASPLDLSAGRSFYLYLDGYGYLPYATGYRATVTLTSGGHTLTRTVPVLCNTWNRVQLRIASWAYRGEVTGISVSYTGIGSSTPWYPHFQIDDVGYTT